jgi:hypothetical protein
MESTSHWRVLRPASGESQKIFSKILLSVTREKRKDKVDEGDLPVFAVFNFQSHIFWEKT